MNDYNFGNFICMLRESKGMTQLEIANMLGVTPAAVSKWENGSSKPRVEVLFQLAKILGVRSEELMAGQFLDEGRINDEAVKRINERYEYLQKIEPYASTGVKLRYLGAWIIDLSIAMSLAYIIATIVYKLLTAANKEGATSILFILGTLFTYISFHDIIGFGRSLGKRIMGLIIVDKRTAKSTKMWKKLLRNLAFTGIWFIIPAFVYVNMFVILIRGQSIDDSIVGTVVLKKERRKRKNPPKANGDPDNVTEKKDASDFGKYQAPSIDYEKINSYKAKPTVTKKFIIGLVGAIIGITVAVFILVVVYFVRFDHYEKADNDISEYAEDVMQYGNASRFMPSLDSLSDYNSIHYSHKTYVYSVFMNFFSNGLALFVEYDESVYESKKQGLLSSADFIDEPIIVNGDYQIPVTELYYKGYYLRIIADEAYASWGAAHSFALIGFDDESNSIVYCYQYDFDRDYIASEGEDLEGEMIKFMDETFEWKKAE